MKLMYVSQNVCEFIYKPISNGLLQQLNYYFFKNDAKLLMMI